MPIASDAAPAYRVLTPSPLGIGRAVCRLWPIWRAQRAPRLTSLRLICGDGNRVLGREHTITMPEPEPSP